jgi:pantothenate kinase
MEKIQKDVTAGMRETLVDWLVEVAEDVARSLLRMISNNIGQVNYNNYKFYDMLIFLPLHRYIIHVVS